MLDNVLFSEDKSFKLKQLDDKPIPSIKGEIRLLIAARNELARLPYFLSYYRNLGIGRFLFIDDHSDDGSRELILNQPDCHVFEPSNSYKESHCGVDWANLLSNTYCNGHWVVTVDADELLVYPHCENITLPQFCSFLESEGSNVFFAFLLDMYTNNNMSDAVCEPGKAFYEICSYFDSDYILIEDRKNLETPLPHMQVIGGPRLRKFYPRQKRRDLISRALLSASVKLADKFGFWMKDKPHHAPALIKAPLLHWQTGCQRLSGHVIANTPRSRMSKVTGALLHFKFFADFHDKAKVEATRGEHYKGGMEYKRYLNHVRNDPNMSFMYRGSRRYVDSASLLNAGLIKTSPELDKFLI